MQELFWQLRSAWYDSVRRMPGLGWILDQEKKQVRILLGRIGVPDCMVLDLGTGSGSTVDLYGPKAIVVAVDRNLSMLRRASKKAFLASVVGDAMSLPMGNHIFPLVGAIGISEYINDLGMFAGEIARVMRSGGFLLFTYSVPGFFNRIRNVLGKRIHTRKLNEIENAFCPLGFNLILQTRSFLQGQCLFLFVG